MLPLWLPVGLLAICLVLALVAFGCAEGSVHQRGQILELRRMLKRKDAQLRRLRARDRTMRMASPRPPARPPVEREPWADPEPHKLIAVDPQLAANVFDTWPELPPAEPTQEVVLDLPLAERFEVVGAQP